MAMTIFVVDDSATMVMSLKTTLSMNGFKVETANNGQAALDKLKAQGMSTRKIARTLGIGYGTVRARLAS